MNEEQQQLDISGAITCGLNTLSSEEVRVAARDVEHLATFKGLLRALLKGELTLATPDRVLPEGVNLPVQESENNNDNDNNN